MVFTGDISELPEKMEKILSSPSDQHPDVIFTARDYRAAKIYQLCEKYSIRIPDDIGVISFDNISWPEAENCGLSTITEDVREIGRQAMFLLQQQFESGYAPVTCIIPGNLVERKSLNQVLSTQKIIYSSKG